MNPWLHRAIFAVLFATTLSPCATAGKLDARARTALARLRAATESVALMRERGAAITREGELDVFITGNATRSELEAAGARLHSALPGMFTASIPAAAVDQVAALPGVTSIRGGVPCAPELDVSVPSTGASLLRGAGPTFAGLNGQGVLVGIVDSGVDYHHGDFLTSTGTNRIVSIWDQAASGAGIPAYPYGKFWTAAQINSGTCAEADSLGHGTHVAGIAAGDGSQTGGGKPSFKYAGMAPRADLVVVKTDFLTPDVIDGIRYVFDQATTRGQNAVVNLSLGSQFGSHDGASEFETGVSALLGPGRIVVKSAGNDRGTALHGQVFATGGGASATIAVSGFTPGSSFGIDGYYDSTERLRVRVQTPGGSVIGPLSLNSENAPWPGQTTTNGLVYVAQDSIDANHRNVYLEAYSDQTSSSLNGTWTITLLADKLGAANGRVDMWRFLATQGLSANFVSGNSPTQELISEPGNAAQVITVGAWVGRTGWTGCNGVAGTYSGTPPVGNLASFSSPGPTRDGRVKPDLVAPGNAIGSTASFDIPHPCPAAPAVSEYLDDGGNHRVFAGTSLAAPHVTGAVALLLQKFGALTPLQAASYLRTHARADGFSGAVPNSSWGYGKLDLGDLIDPVVKVLSPHGGEQVLIGQNLPLTWIATDQLGSVASVDVELSRTGPAGSFATLAGQIPNSGVLNWTVTGPGAAVGAAYLRVRAHDTNSNVGSAVSESGFTIIDPVAVGEDPPIAFGLAPVLPNPSTGRMQIRYSVARESFVRLCVCDIQGREVSVLARGVYRAGNHLATWEGVDGRSPLPSGLYFIRLDTVAGRWIQRVAILR